MEAPDDIGPEDLNVEVVPQTFDFDDDFKDEGKGT